MYVTGSKNKRLQRMLVEAEKKQKRVEELKSRGAMGMERYGRDKCRNKGDLYVPCMLILPPHRELRFISLVECHVFGAERATELKLHGEGFPS